VNRALSALASLFQLVYAAICFVAVLNLTTVYRMLTTPEYRATFGVGPLHAQVNLLLHTFRYDYSLALLLFGLHLILVGSLIVRSRYMPSWLGAILLIDGLGWIVIVLGPYLYPSANIGFVFITSLGEIVFMLWLLLVGSRLQEPAPALA